MYSQLCLTLLEKGNSALRVLSSIVPNLRSNEYSRHSTNIYKEGGWIYGETNEFAQINEPVRTIP